MYTTTIRTLANPVVLAMSCVFGLTTDASESEGERILEGERWHACFFALLLLLVTIPLLRSVAVLVLSERRAID